jgi:hypothetical protein
MATRRCHASLINSAKFLGIKDTTSNDRKAKDGVAQTFESRL